MRHLLILIVFLFPLPNVGGVLYAEAPSNSMKKFHSKCQSVNKLVSDLHVSFRNNNPYNDSIPYYVFSMLYSFYGFTDPITAIKNEKLDLSIECKELSQILNELNSDENLVPDLRSATQDLCASLKLLINEDYLNSNDPRFNPTNYTNYHISHVAFNLLYAQHYQLSTAIAPPSEERQASCACTKEINDLIEEVKKITLQISITNNISSNEVSMRHLQLIDNHRNKWRLNSRRVFKERLEMLDVAVIGKKRKKQLRTEYYSRLLAELKQLRK